MQEQQQQHSIETTEGPLKKAVWIGCNWASPQFVLFLLPTRCRLRPCADFSFSHARQPPSPRMRYLFMSNFSCSVNLYFRNLLSISFSKDFIMWGVAVDKTKHVSGNITRRLHCNTIRNSFHPAYTSRLVIRHTKLENMRIPCRSNWVHQVVNADAR